MLIVAFIGAWIINYELTLFLQYSRPDIQPPSLTYQVLTIPSGNFLQGTVLYGTTAYLLSLLYPQLTYWFYGSAILLVSSIGFSRLYLGVQWPFDVLAGLISGFLWLIICIILLRLQDIRQLAKLQKKRMSAARGR